jgi:pyruvate dehydrogenase E2 component (dihydrolipoamide acetyltransferase)
MAFEVVMPRLGWNMEEGALAGWRKQDGDQVTAGEILFEVESDKAIQEVEALESGILRIPADSPAKGKVVPVGTLLAYLLKAGEAIPTGTATASPQAASAAPQAPHAAVHPPAPAAPAALRVVAAPRRKSTAVSPRAKRVAAELGVDWTLLRGSGTSGRVVERDVRQAASAGPRPQRAAAGRMPSTRRLIAERMTESALATAAVTLTTELDATELVELRGKFKRDGASLVPSYVDLLVKVAAFALQEHLQLGSRLEGDAIVQAEGANIGIAVDTERGLLVPVLRDAHAKSLRAIAEESAALIEKTRTGKISAEEMRGATFTITNLGMYEIDAFTPIINLPECAILGVGRIVAKQVVTDAEAGTVAIRRMAFLSLTFDHRLVDGAPAARFLQRIKQLVERPYLWLAGG